MSVETIENSLQLVMRPSEEIDHAATGARVREARKARKLTLWTVASQMTFTPGYLADLETGKRKWDQQKIDLVSGALRKVELKR